MHSLLSKISYDQVQTHEKMKLLPYSLESCDCAYCQNYIANLPAFPIELITLLATLGIDSKKPSEIMQVDEVGAGHLYIATYHFIGSCPGLGAEPLIHKTENYTLYFTTEEMDFVPETFPQEVVQIMVEIILPWKIEEKE
ncbi:hypothetical protein [Paenisporosarcina quisquiliarum]|uniref:hypothetical protein n=1 Tax=Paenisporosarcina quisquiliarum TaxID=365346 RepID=UPI003735CF1F